MEVQNIPIPAPAAIKVTKEGKQGVFETKIIQTTDNKYIYCLPVRRNNKVVNYRSAKPLQLQLHRKAGYRESIYWAG